MRSAPPVSVRCSGGAAWHVVCAGLHALAAGALAGWAFGQAGWPVAPALAVVFFVALWAWLLARPASVHLVWDGQRWQADGVAGRLSVMIDAGAFLLLRLQPDGQRQFPRWVAATAREAGPAMHALRAAAYARLPGTAASAVAAPDGVPLPR